MALESMMAATKRMRPPQSGHSSTSISRPRRMSSAQVRLHGAGDLPGSAARTAPHRGFRTCSEANDLASPPGVRREHPVIDDEVHVGARNQRRELFEQLLRFQGDVIGAVAPRRLEADEDPSIRRERQPIFGDRRPER